MIPVRGWTFLYNSKKWHYFTDESNISLCGKFMLLKLPELDDTNDNSPDNCVVCKKRKLKRGEKLSNEDGK